MSLFLGLILLITLTVAFFVSYFISMPLVKLTKNIDEISKGNLDVELEKSEIYEINTSDGFLRSRHGKPETCYQ